MSDVLRAKLSAVRYKSVLVNAGAGACMAAGAVIVALGLGMAIDWLWELPFAARAALFAIDLAMFATIFARDIIWPVLNRPDDDEIALWVERESPGLRSRLISAIQLGRPEAIPAGGSVSLVRALVHETETITAPMDFLAVVKADRLARFGAFAALAVVLASFGMAYGGQSSLDLLQRAILVPGVEVPRKTRVQVLVPNPLIMARGEGVELRAHASGIVPGEGTLQIQYDNDKHWAAVKMPADADHAGQFAVQLETVPDSFTYRVLLNDGHSAPCRVEAAVRPSAAGMEIREIFPEYTGLQPIKRLPGDLRLLAGSRLTLRVTSNKPLKETAHTTKLSNRVTLHEKSTSVDFPLSVDSTNPMLLTARDAMTNADDIPVPADADGLSIHLVDENGLETKDPAVYHIEMIPDAAPTVRVTYPDRKEQLSTARAKLIIGVEASDDFALGKLTLHYKVLPPEIAQGINDQATQDGPVQSLSSTSPPATGGDSIAFDLRGTPREFRGRFDFRLDQLKTVPLEHGAVEWWLEAEDTNTASGPGKAVTDHYLTKIVTEAEVRTDLFTRLGNHMGQIKEQEETMKEDNADLGEMIQEKVNGEGIAN